MKRFHILFFSLCFLAASVCSAANYWISFSTQETLFVMKISSSGTILVPPTDIGHTLDTPFMTTMTPDGTRFAVWSVVTGNSGDDGPVYRILVEKATLQATTPSQFAVAARREKEAYSLSSSQSPANIFLAFKKGKAMKGFGVNATEKWDGRKFRIAPSTEGNFLVGGVAADGLMSWVIAPEVDGKVYLQPLSATGPSSGPVAVVGGAPSGQTLLYSDLSNPLAGGKRLLALLAEPSGTPHSPVEPLSPLNGTTSSLYTQFVDASTGQKLTPRSLVASGFSNEAGRTFAPIAVDPRGAFLLFTGEDVSCLTNRIFYQPLDGAGNAAGAPTPLTLCNMDPASHVGPIGLDILIEE